MKKITVNIVFFLLPLIVFIISCSTEKNTFISRNYHNLTTHYNGYFNSKESFKEAINQIHLSHKDDYDKLLDIFIDGDKNTISSVLPKLNRAIEKASLMIQRHSMFIQGNEYNKWIDDCFLIIGKSQFYKQDYNEAIKTLSYLARAFKRELNGKKAELWLIRTYIAQKNYTAAQIHFDLIDKEKRFPIELKSFYLAIKADYNIKQNEYDKAIPFLEEATTLLKDKKLKARYYFILAQLYNKKGDSNTANKYFGKVIELHPGFDMTFNAKINRALSLSKRSANKNDVKKELYKMLKDKKNSDFYDQIYYALAGISLKENNIPQAIDYLKKSISYNLTNTKQKGKSYLKLAEIYFSKPDYKNAYFYYDSASNSLPQDFENINEIKQKRDGLKKLVEQLKIVEEQDSLLNIASLPEKERIKIINKIIEKVKQEKENKIIENENNTLFLNQQQNNNFNSNSGDWYFYNPTMVGLGISEFKKKWGDRKNEDNWRRKNKNSLNITASETYDFTKTDSLADDESIDYYLKQLPLSKEKQLQAHKKIMDALYQIGIIYKEEFNDYYEAIFTFNDLLKRYDTTHYKPAIYYYLYLLYFEVDDPVKANKYKNMILKNFPESEYAKILRNPDYYKELKRKEKATEILYSTTFKDYKMQKYTAVLNDVSIAQNKYPDNKLMPKFIFLKALAMKEIYGIDSLKKYMIIITNKYPNDNVKPKAEEILKMLDNGINKKDNNNKVQFAKDDNSIHYFMILVNSNANTNKINFSISDFNTKFFKGKGLKVNVLVLDKNRKIILVKQFDNAPNAMKYYNIFKSEKDILKDINNKYEYFVINKTNFKKVFSNKLVSEYADFFKKTYLNSQ